MGRGCAPQRGRTTPGRRSIVARGIRLEGYGRGRSFAVDETRGDGVGRRACGVRHGVRAPDLA